MSRHFIPDLHGRAALVRIDHGDELTWDKVAERITGFGDSMTKRELELVVGYLAASILQRRST
jgi:hypothetical protein